MATKTTTKAEPLPRGLQIAALVTLGGSYLLQWGLTLNTVLQQLPHNSNLSSYYMFFLGSFVMPVVFFIGAYFLSPRKISVVGRLFESLLIMVVGQTAAQMFVQFAYLMPGAFGTSADQAFANFILYEAIAVGIATLLYFATLLYLRKTKRWK